MCGRGGSDRLDRGRSRVDVDKFRVDVGSTGLCDSGGRVVVDGGSSVSVTAISGWLRSEGSSKSDAMRQASEGSK